MKVKTSTIVGLTIGGILAVSGAVLMGVGASMASRRNLPAIGSVSEWENVSGLSVTLPECQLSLICDETAEVCTVTLENMAKEPQISMEGGTLVIEDKMNLPFHFIDLGLIDKQYGSVTVVLPPKEYSEIILELGISQNSEISGIDAYEIDFEIGAGNCTMMDVAVSKDLTLQCGAGELTLDNLIVAGDCKLDFGVGEVRAKNLLCESDLDLDFGVGDFEAEIVSCRDIDFDSGIGDVAVQNLTLLGDMKIDHGIGNFELLLNGDAEKFGLECDMGIGNVRFNGRHIGYLQGEHMISVDGGIGEISIETASEGTFR